MRTKKNNRVLIRNEIYYSKNPTRTQVARALGLTKPTLTAAVNDMIQQGMVSECPMRDAEMANTVGRRPMILSYNRDYASAIGVEVGPYSTEAVLTDMNGQILRYQSGVVAQGDYQDLLKIVSDLIRAVMPEDRQRLAGIGIGLPGFVDSASGQIRTASRGKWDNAQIGHDLYKLFGFPVIADNNVRLRAVGYDMTHKDAQEDEFAYFYVSKGMACPIMFRNESISGSSSGAGEVGNTILSVEEDGRTERKAEELASEQAIMERAQLHLMQGEFPALKKILMERGIIHISDVVALQKDGDEIADRIIRSVLQYTGITLANVINLLNPGLVVVDAFIMENQVNRQTLFSGVSRRLYGLNESEVQIRFLPYSKEVGAVGAALNIIRHRILEA